MSSSAPIKTRLWLCVHTRVSAATVLECVLSISWLSFSWFIEVEHRFVKIEAFDERESSLILSDRHAPRNLFSCAAAGGGFGAVPTGRREDFENIVRLGEMQSVLGELNP